jgi:membrane associated rhomboid family serine protease
MISLVTQSDGSARRWPIVSIVIAIAMSVLFFGSAGETKHARGEADAAIAEAIDQFEQYPFVSVPDEMEPYMAAEWVQELRTAYEDQWVAIESPGIPERMRVRVQNEFDERVELALARIDSLPVNVHAFRTLEGEPLRLFDHVLYHALLPALLLSIAVVLLVGIPLEDAWGSIVFGLYCAVMIPLGPVLFSVLQAGSAVPWIGGSGLAAGLLGATLARWLESGSPRLVGALPLAAWWVLPTWAATEYGVVRGLGWGQVGTAPVEVHLGLAAAGLFLALAIRALGLEDKLSDRWDESKDAVRNPKLEKAMQLRDLGQRDEALSLLTASFAKRADVDVATALWDVSKELGTPEVGAPAVLWRVRDAIRRRQPDVALDFWCELVGVLDVIDVEPPMFVKLAELLIDRDREVDGLLTIERMLCCGKSITAKVALRAAELTAGRDAELTSRVASAAIEGGGSVGREHKQLEELVIKAAPGLEAFLNSELPDAETRVPGGEPLHAKKRVLPAFRGLRAKPAEPVAPSAPPPEPEPDFDAADYDALDPNAICPDALDAEPGTTDSLADAVGESSAADPSEIEKWNSPGLIRDLSEELSDAERAADSSMLEEADTPLAALSRGDDCEANAVRETAPMFDAKPEPGRPKRRLDAIPISLDFESLEMDVAGKGKARIPLGRIEAIAVGAVRELGAKPVLLVDLVLNWNSGSSQMLKLLRIRSDRFNPRLLLPGSDSGIEALRAFTAAIIDGARPVCLPDESAVRGKPFAVHDTLAQYEEATTG